MDRLLRSALLISVALGACSSDASDGSQIDPRPLDEQYPARIVLSDAGEFYAAPQIIISGRGSADPQSGAQVVLQANGANFPTDPTTEAHREGRPGMQTGFTIEISAGQGKALALGEAVAIGGDGVTYGLSYGEPNRQITRTIATLKLSANTDSTVTLVISFVPGFRPVDPALPPDDPTLGTAERMTVTGQIPVVCTPPPMLADDPNFTTEFCRDALDEFGLRAIREAQL